AINRLRRASVLAVVERHRALFLKDLTDQEIRELTEEDLRPHIQATSEHIRATLAAAWERYERHTPAPEQEGDFRTYLESTPDEQECLVYVNSLRDLFSEMWIMGLNSAELRRSKDTVLGPITPHNMGQDQLAQTSEIGSVS
ncbi:MAG: hypothetical protein IH830_13950, partial [Planctomycetes bacterium]|nr:hypothetical protein [Planctomycetota bacterium]